jgi:hypothetical protein
MIGMPRLFGIMLLAGALAGCSSAGKFGFGSDGSVHPDVTSGFADYSGQGRGGEGWAGNSDGEGGPSAIQPVADDPEENK